MLGQALDVRRSVTFLGCNVLSWYPLDKGSSHLVYFKLRVRVDVRKQNIAYRPTLPNSRAYPAVAAVVK